MPYLHSKDQYYLATEAMNQYDNDYMDIDDDGHRKSLLVEEIDSANDIDETDFVDSKPRSITEDTVDLNEYAIDR